MKADITVTMLDFLAHNSQK